MASKALKNEEFQKYMKESSWLKATVAQLVKDAQMAGVEAPDLTPENGLTACLEQLVSWTIKLRHDSKSFQNFNYRVDVPLNAQPELMEDSALATLYLFRCFQKVWLRKQFSANSTKDDGETRQKHLKP